MHSTSPRVAVLFPGQGAQKVGMGTWLMAYPETKRIFALASAVSGADIATLCREGPLEELQRTELAQPALLAVGLSCWAALRQAGVVPAAAAGHSLGEFGAWVVSGLLDEETALRLVAERGRAMGEAAAARPGGMAAVMGLPPARVEQICREVESTGPVVPSNLNCPGQVVISGSQPALERALALVTAAGGKAMRLPVAGAFHSPLMEQASARFTKVIESVRPGQVKVPVAANYTGTLVAHQADAVAALRSQMLGAVHWEAAMRSLLGAGITLLLEMAPGRTLAGLMRRIAPEVRVISVDDEAALAEAVATVRGA